MTFLKKCIGKSPKKPVLRWEKAGACQPRRNSIYYMRTRKALAVLPTPGIGVPPKRTASTAHGYSTSMMASSSTLTSRGSSTIHALLGTYKGFALIAVFPAIINFHWLQKKLHFLDLSTIGYC